MNGIIKVHQLTYCGVKWTMEISIDIYRCIYIYIINQCIPIVLYISWALFWLYLNLCICIHDKGRYWTELASLYLSPIVLKSVLCSEHFRGSHSFRVYFRYSLIVSIVGLSFWWAMVNINIFSNHFKYWRFFCILFYL